MQLLFDMFCTLMSLELKLKVIFLVYGLKCWTTHSNPYIHSTTVLCDIGKTELFDEKCTEYMNLSSQQSDPKDKTSI